MGRRIRKRETKDSGSIYLLCALIAIELFMSFSFLGYIHIEPISLTFVYIPVLITGCVMGPKESTLVGAVFGVASMWKASAFYVSAGDAIFSPLMSGKPLQSILLSVGSRTLFGLLVGLMYAGARKSKHPLAGILLVSSVGRTIHTFLVYLCMGLFFPETGFHVNNVLDDILRWDFLPFVLIADIMVLFCYLFLKSAYAKRLKYRIQTVDRLNALVVQNRRVTAAALILMSVCAVSVAVYFVNRLGTVLRWYGIELSSQSSYDLLHLQKQFLLGILSLAFLVVLALMLYQKNFNYLYYEARLDGLTGLLGRYQFFQAGKRMLERMRFDHKDKQGCFIILDVDSFKEINDSYGHPEGDKILKKVSGELKTVFDSYGILGRLGGDEFVALIQEPMTREEIERRLILLKEGINRIQCHGEQVSCSIGVIPAEKSCSIEELYRGADRLLYEAKKKGKNQFVFGYRYRDQAK